MDPEKRAEIEAEVFGKVGSDLARTTLAIMREIEGPEWPGPNVADVEFGQAADGRLTLHVGDAVYYFNGGDRIVERTPGRLRVLDRKLGVVSDVRPDLN